MIRSTAIPTANNKKEFIQEISLVAQGPPFKPAIKVVNHVEPKDEKDMAKQQTGSHQYEFGKSMHEYAKKNINSKEIPASKSEGNLQSKKLLNNHHPHLNKAHHHHHQHQCCSGFGAGSRHRSNACVIN